MGYVGRTSSLIFSVGLGIGQGYQPVAAFNYGARKFSRVKKGTWFTLAFGASFMGIISAACFIFAPDIIALFRNDADVVRIGGEALRIMCIFLMFLPISVVATMLFQSIGKSLPAFILSCIQSGLIFIPLCLTLPSFFGVRGIEISQPLAYFTSALISLPMAVSFLKSLPEDDN